jgi:hypothetical protein
MESGEPMDIAEAVSRLEAAGYSVRASFQAPNGYDVIVPICEVKGYDDEPTVVCHTTTFWPEASGWIWEPDFVVPGPGPRRRYADLGSLIPALIADCERRRESCPVPPPLKIRWRD